MLPYREVGLISLLLVGLSSLKDGCLSQPPDVVAAVQESPKDNAADGTAASKAVAMEWGVTSKCCVQAEFFRRRFRYEL